MTRLIYFTNLVTLARKVSDPLEYTPSLITYEVGSPRNDVEMSLSYLAFRYLWLKENSIYWSGKEAESCPWYFPISFVEMQLQQLLNEENSH